MEERTPEGRVSPLWTPHSGLGYPSGYPSFFLDWPAALCPTLASARPPAGRAGAGVSYKRDMGGCPATSSGFPLGGSCLRSRLMRGRFCTQPFLVESPCPTACRLYAGFLLLRWVPGRPLIRPGCAGPPSPQGEGFGWGKPVLSSAFIQAEVPFRLYRGGSPPHASQPAQPGGGPLRASVANW